MFCCDWLDIKSKESFLQDKESVSGGGNFVDFSHLVSEKMTIIGVESQKEAFKLV